MVDDGLCGGWRWSTMVSTERRSTVGYVGVVVDSDGVVGSNGVVDSDGCGLRYGGAVVVKDLFIPNTNLWNKELIEHNFLPWEAESILGIPVSHYPTEDLLTWPHTSDGSYSFGPPRSKIFRSFGDLASAVLAVASPATAALFSMVAWSIWIRRNKLREKQTVWDVGETVQRARELLQEFWDVAERPSRSGGMRLRVKWTPPAAGSYKINFDGSIFESSGRAGLGVVVRDADGMVIAALSQNIPLPSSVDADAMSQF
ncbi:hypothetical protein CFP56_037026 [Quercus suber]|uniref:RNase H type-1 domain-containing protein n=1 Tax=Quercus suber TaxID=58331 RepID=A0AAW0J692_QUESU